MSRESTRSEWARANGRRMSWDSVSVTACPGGGAYLGVVGCGDGGQGHAGVVDGGQDLGEVIWSGGEGLRSAGGVGRACVQGPAGIGIGKAPGPQREVGGFGCCRGDGAVGVCFDVVPGAGGAEPRQSRPRSRAGRGKQARAEPGGTLLRCAGGQGLLQDLAVVADDRCAGGGLAECQRS